MELEVSDRHFRNTVLSPDILLWWLSVLYFVNATRSATATASARVSYGSTRGSSCSHQPAYRMAAPCGLGDRPDYRTHW